MDEIEKEQGRWQHAIYLLLHGFLGADAWRLDGSGCESGDPLDVTLAEITQALNMIEERVHDATSESK